MNRSFL